MTKDRYEIIYIILIFSVAIIIRCHQITLPWIEADIGTDGSIVGNAARNFLRYSLFETKFGVVTNSGPVVDGNFTYAIDHPYFLFTLIISIFFRVFGVHEWSARLVPILFSMGNLIMIYIIANKLWDKRTAFFSMLFMAFMPMTAFFSSRDVWPYSMGIFLSMLVIWFYISWIRQYRLKYYYGAIISYAISLLSLWDVYFLGPILFIYHILNRGKKVKLVILFPMLNFLVFILILVHTYFLTSSIEQLWNIFLYRTGVNKDISLFQFFTLESYRSIKYFTITLCLLSIIGIWNEVRNHRNKNLRGKLLLFLFFWGAPFALLFREGAMHQIAWISSLSPFFALSGALGLVFLQDSVLPKITYEHFGKRFFWSLSIIALVGCIFLAFHRSGEPDIGRYSWFYFKIYMVYIALTTGLLLFTWRMSKYSLQKILHQVHPVALLLLFLFLVQSLFVVYTLHQERGWRLDYTIAKSINKNTQFEDAVIISISLCYYYYPYYADRYVVQNIRTKADYLKVLKNENRPFKYYLTTNWELMKKKYVGKDKISESTIRWLSTKGIRNKPCELDEYMSNNFVGKVVDSWIIYDLSKGKTSY